MTFERVDNLPPQLFCDASNLEYLSLPSVTMEGSLSGEDFRQLFAGVGETSIINGAQIHLDIPRYPADVDVGRTLRPLLPILSRVWKLSGQYDNVGEVALLSVAMLRARDMLRELSLTFSNAYAQLDDEPLNMVPIIIFPAKNLERLALKFNQSLSKAPNFDEPNLSELLGNMTSMFSLIRRCDTGCLPKLSTVSIEMHNVPSRCLLREGIEKEGAMWEGLDDVLSKKGYLPGLERLQLRLVLRSGETMSMEEIHSSVSRLLPSLAPAVRMITINSP
ncbi:hypothetical protein BKA70DRAFT_1313790 [Coprinopsis sp. MPI-PUGE-AT-0042]|nr:hypothetical protein BKA70DRAFT_1313790 [Coprinopsis sp. MPI-PUGE-AT-0042]